MKMAITNQPQTYVLVHGANHGGWCFNRTAERLRGQGHRVFAPTLTGLAERSRDPVGAINLTTHINDILSLFKWEELEDAVLVGHSYGGMVISGVADKIPEKIRNLVFLDAVVPENGKCMADYTFPGDMLLQVLHAVGSVGGGLWLPAPPAAFFNINEADRVMADRLCTPHPMASLLEKISIGTNTESIKHHTYIFATNWNFPPIMQQYELAKARPGWKTFEVECGHDIMLDKPAELAEILSGL